MSDRDQLLASPNAGRDFDLRRRSVEHPALGPASAYEFLLLMAAHPARHARQIQEGRGL